MSEAKVIHRLKEVSGIGNRGKIPLEFKVRVLALCRLEGNKAREAITTAAEEFKLKLSPSYDTHPGSHKFRFEKEVTKKLTKGDTECIELCKKHTLVEEEMVEEEEEEEA